MDQPSATNAPRSTVVSRASGAAGTLRSRVLLIAIAVAVGAVAKVLFLLWHAPYERSEVVPYEEFAKVRDGWYVSHYFGGTVMGLGFIALALAACLLVRRAGSTWTTVGAALTGLGGLMVGPGLAAEGASYSYASDTDALPREQGAGLLRYMFEHDERSANLLVLGLMLVVLGSVVLAVGLIRARVVPLWVPIALAIGAVALAATPHSITWWASLPGTVAALAIGWYAWRGVRD